MKRMNFVFAVLCISALLATSCSQGTLSTRQMGYNNINEFARIDVDYVERLVRSRMTTPLAITFNLRSEIRSQAQKDGGLVQDDIYWLNWADTKFPAAMRPQYKNFGAAKNETSDPYQR